MAMGSILASRQLFRNGVCFYRWIRRIAGMRTEAPSPDVRIADRPCGLHRRFGYRRFLVSPVRPIAGFVLEALSPEFPSPEPHIAGRSIAGRFLMCYRRVSKSGDEIRRYQATSRKFCLAFGGCKLQQTRPWLGLVDLSRIPSGTFFREVHPGSEMASQNDQNKAK